MLQGIRQASNSIPKEKVTHKEGIESKQEGNTDIKVNGSVLEKVQNFKYLGSVKTSDGTCAKDVKTRKAMAKQKMIQLKNIWKDRIYLNT